MTQSFIKNNRNSVDSSITLHTASRPSIQISNHEADHIRDSQPQAMGTEVSSMNSAAVDDTSSNDANTRQRRSSLAVFADRLRSSSRSRSRSPSHHRKSLDSTTSRDSLDSTGSAYEDVVKAQELYMKNLRTRQHALNITHNVDGLPLPPFPGTEERQKRRSSLVKILGMDKPLLAR
ncbi:hypothetical protein BGZ94_010350 [Podila epigama]|nr:hypothetical protein BGZ94_010350 [Podila epigama]